MKSLSKGNATGPVNRNFDRTSVARHCKTVFGILPIRNPSSLALMTMLIAGVLATPTLSMGAQKLWSGLAGDTLWSTGGNWSPAGMPGVSDNVTFTNDGVAANPFTLGGAVNNIVDAAFLAASINSLGYMNTNGFHNTQ